ncbi:MAG: hypothetical protein DME49_08715 [Verrucomicrobia bacterium]|nr:MAG: hypothetical protein DME49_08715 [Verrucomicrobiota bacterium]PYK92620.1 MAG: hypothetical protein DME36_12585 [Verrucomicrobiota bacterium]PYL39201.1 MAG: hypothetical protein DMF34_04675 [Verrucomicrobiota bacterium]
MALVIGGKGSAFNAQGRTESVRRKWSEAGARDIDGKPNGEASGRERITPSSRRTGRVDKLTSSFD